MDHATLVCVCESGADLFEIKERFLERQRSRLRKSKQVATRQILEHDVMEGRAREIDGGAVSKTVYNVRMANAIERDRFVLKVGDERALQFDVGRVLQVEIEGLDNDRALSAFGRGVVVGDIDLRVAATSEALENIVAAIKSTLL